MDQTQQMYVVKRNGAKQEVSFDKITTRIKQLCLPISEELGLRSLTVDAAQLVMQVVNQLYPGIETSEIDSVTAEQCAAMCTRSLDYGELASRIVVSNHHKGTRDSFYQVMRNLHGFVDVNGANVPMVSEAFHNVVAAHGAEIDAMIDYDRDYLIDYFGFKTLERAYMTRINGVIAERPQHVWMRVAIGIHGDDMEKVKETYDLMSQKYFTHATPTLFNAGTPHPQLSSCYLVAMEDDSIDGIFNTVKECAMISKWAGGVGMHVHNVRGTGSHIRGTNGTSNGLVPMLRVFNSTARYVDQGGGKRNGSIAVYLEPWHPDVCDWLDLKKNHGDEELRARDLFYALWIPDLFMKRVKEDGDWHLFCPDSARGLSGVYGEEFEELYERYASEGKAKKTMKARDLWFRILDSQMETGTPYLLYKDAANSKSNQKNLGTIKSSNLCTEIIEYSNKDQTAVCNLASIGLSSFVRFPSVLSGDEPVKVYTKEKCKWCTRLKGLLKLRAIEYTEVQVQDEDFDSFKKEHGVETLPQLYHGDKRVGGYTDTAALLQPAVDLDELHRVTGVVTRNLNKVIDVNFYPTPKTERSNLLHRPIGIGVQGLADVFAMLGYPFESEEARELNKAIFETMYHAAVTTSCAMSKERTADMQELHNRYENGNVAFDEQRKYSVDGCADHKAVRYQLERLLPVVEEFDAIKNGGKAGAYSSFAGSPASNGELQFDMWGVTPSDRYNWDLVRSEIKEHGLRNSLLLAPMPTASTSQILGNNECFEPFTSNIYSRRTIAGDYVVVNKHLMRELESLGIWSQEVKDMIVRNKGSVQDISGIPDDIKEKYKIVWEIPMRSLIDMAADRGAFICQSQSMNLWLEDPDYKTLTSMHFHAWSKGLKTGLYYLRRKPKHQPQQFTIVPPSGQVENDQEEGCLMCGA